MNIQLILVLRKALQNSVELSNFGSLSEAARNVDAVAYARGGFGGQPPPLTMGREVKTFLFILTIRFCFARN